MSDLTRKAEPNLLKTEQGSEAQIQGAEEFAGQSDHLQRLWTPHRMAYIGGEARPSDGSAKQCPFCLIPQKSDVEGLVVARGELAYVVLNLFPYNNGHLMVCPFEHVATYDQVSADVVAEIGYLTQRAMRALTLAMSPAGFNIGMNQGDAGGAGIAAHLHQHVVPRWSGDANFFPIIAQTKAMPSLLGQTRDQLATAWEQCA